MATRDVPGTEAPLGGKSESVLVACCAGIAIGARQRPGRGDVVHVRIFHFFPRSPLRSSGGSGLKKKCRKCRSSLAENARFGTARSHLCTYSFSYVLTRESRDFFFFYYVQHSMYRNTRLLVSRRLHPTSLAPCAFFLERRSDC